MGRYRRGCSSREGEVELLACLSREHLRSQGEPGGWCTEDGVLYRWPLTTSGQCLITSLPQTIDLEIQIGITEP